MIPRLIGPRLNDLSMPPQPSDTNIKTAPQPKRPILPYVCLLIFLATFITGPLFLLSFIAESPSTAPQTVLIPRGSTVQDIGAILDKQRLLIHPFLFRISARMMAKDHLKAGEYEFPAGINVLDLTRMLMEGRTVPRQITVAEGLTVKEILEALNSEPTLTGVIESELEEGSLLPETYNFSYGDSRSTILSRMQKDQARLLASLWDTREQGIPLSTPREALVLASIVEKETGIKASERAKVAGVFINRLRLGMPLQSDPTVIYAHTMGKRDLGHALLRKELEIDSPYNTYRRTGLPPTPICNPGRAALEATLHPEKHDYLYFVADGTGGHAFAKTLIEHNDNVARWQSLKTP